jgi:hypothetical protein
MPYHADAVEFVSLAETFAIASSYGLLAEEVLAGTV